MATYVKMMDKDGVGFQMITVEDPAQIRFKATDVDMEDYPVLMVSKPPSGVLRYPLVNDAYIMNHQGETISKIVFKEALREIGKEEYRKDQPGQSGKSFDEMLGKKSLGNRNFPLGVNSSLPRNLAPGFVAKEPVIDPDKYFVSIDKFVEVKKRDIGWVIDINGKSAKVDIFTPNEISELLVWCEEPHLLSNWFSGNSYIDEQTRQSLMVEVIRNNLLRKEAISVLGDSCIAFQECHPLIKSDIKLLDKDNYYVILNGVKVEYKDLTMGQIVRYNVFYEDPMNVELETGTREEKEKQFLMLQNSTVFFALKPEARKAHSTVNVWLDYRELLEAKTSMEKVINGQDKSVVNELSSSTSAFDNSSPMGNQFDRLVKQHSVAYDVLNVKERIIEINTPASVESLLQVGESINSVTVERVHFKAIVNHKELYFTVKTSLLSNTMFCEPVTESHPGTKVLGMTVLRYQVESLEGEFACYIPMISFIINGSFSAKENKLVIAGNKVKVDGLARADGESSVMRGQALKEHHEIMNRFSQGEVVQVDLKVISN